jgi:hypothetical protein
MNWIKFADVHLALGGGGRTGGSILGTLFSTL